MTDPTPAPVPDRITLTRGQLAALLAHHADVLAAAFRTDASTGLPGYRDGLNRAADLLGLHADHLTAEEETRAVTELLDSMLTCPIEQPAPEDRAALRDRIAGALQNAGVDDTTKREVLGGLISGLQDGDWDTEDESPEDFLDDPAIVAAFHDHKVHTHDRRCCQSVAVSTAQERITQALADKFADGAPEDEMYVEFRLTEGELRTRGVTPQEVGEIAVGAIRDLIGGEPDAR